MDNVKIKFIEAVTLKEAEKRVNEFIGDKRVFSAHNIEVVMLKTNRVVIMVHYCLTGKEQ